MVVAIVASLKPVPGRVVEGLSSVYRWESFPFDFDFMTLGFVVEAASLVVVVRFERVVEEVLGGGAFGILVVGSVYGGSGLILVEMPD